MLIILLALHSNSDYEECLSYVGTEGNAKLSVYSVNAEQRRSVRCRSDSSVGLLLSRGALPTDSGPGGAAAIAATRPGVCGQLPAHVRSGVAPNSIVTSAHDFVHTIYKLKRRTVASDNE